MRTNQGTEIVELRIPTPFHVGPINVFLLKGETCTLVDVGPKTKEAYDLLARFLKENGLSWHNIDYVFLTHQHVDHTGLTAEVVRRSGATVLAHPGVAPYVTMEPAFMQYHNEFFYALYEQNGVPAELLDYVARFQEMMNRYSEPAPVHRFVEEGEMLEGDREWQYVYTPGHTQNHLALYRERDRTMLSGDFLIKKVSSNAFLEPPMQPGQARPKPLLVYREAMQRIAGMPICRMLSAHGEHIENPAELIAHRLQRNEERARRIQGLLAGGSKTVFELSALLFPSIYVKELPLTFSETLGHLDFLVEEGQVEAVWLAEEGVYRYRQR
ncbi:MBL fold metallo-hydrolase [Aneurinibacillus sp. BA2021]|nr:MBL fold metallo-hydrolase [Aneurinibacillus sp. BA2021]